jgi:hypothetical protein
MFAIPEIFDWAASSAGGRRIRQDLTTCRNVGMIAAMFRRVVAALLVIGWISLSGFDVVEDLDEALGQIQLSGSKDSAQGSKRAMGSLANNMIESASRTKPVNLAIENFALSIFRFEPLTEFRKHVQLHKLYRVFLI